MKKVLLAGASGHLGLKIAQELKQRNYYVRALIRTPEKAPLVSPYADEVVVADVTRPETLRQVGEGMDVVISALGRTVGIQQPETKGYWDIDYQGNLHLLRALESAPVQKFIYISAFGAEHFPNLRYFKAHQAFADELSKSGLPYTIIKPPALFSAFREMLDMAQHRPLAYLGNGRQRTNPIWEGDLARICVDAISDTKKVIEAGGDTVYTRREIIQKISLAAGAKPPRSIPFWAVRPLLWVLRFSNRNLHDTAAFYVAVSRHDLIAPRRGTHPLEEYLVHCVNRGKTIRA
ncbi:Uncharacterized conserved protein YbjT, contains NAD(P)-binding and DUF2867 domains [Catalinimonas alkaloidigena]|uniref:Uncharacterized conserved protein YbjT, contains NAD(P)-binding and DUF2867 domains n=1 Tax=Catalinimonas alkaloidigena TaxID=1075417 RepID=A0A1G8YDC3_9BACT|nr:SDR family oxidoreductase [Catalinimonas alkaloidigena]SDK00726.1 Uncharacterized conserved protein YbjT, contains NAD(P)-binding and DUF2867 domains [Catalinimonas alkaloidigena]